LFHYNNTLARIVNIVIIALILSILLQSALIFRR